MKVKQRLWWVLGGVFLVFCIGFVLAAYHYSWSDTGFLNKSLWDWLQLLIVPLMLAVVALVFQLANTRTDRLIARQRYEQDQKISLDKQHEDLLQAYIDKMSELLVEKHLHESAPDDDVREIARVRTLTVLSRVDKTRKRSVLLFLYEASLILIDKDKHIIDLHGADLSETDLSETDLSEADLSNADLSGANLSGTTLRKADLHEAKLRRTYLGSVDLSGTKLIGTDLSNANLHHANLSSATLELADLSDANLRGAILSGVQLFGADLSGANLREANLSDAILREADLSGADLSDAILRRADLHGAKLREAAQLFGADLKEATLDEADRRDAKVATELEASAKAETSPKLPNPDRKYPSRPDGVRGPLRTFGGPLRLPCNVKYTGDEYTVKYIQRARSVLVGKYIIPVLIFLGLIISLFYFPSLSVYIGIGILIMILVFIYIFINYWDDIYILTSKRVIDINRRFIFLDEEHLSIEYGQIKDVRVQVSNPLYIALDVGNVVVETPGNNPDLVMRVVDHPFAIQDMVYTVKKYREKQQERKR
jgi:uncharacterized protein YjbI with pentapeptide repeats